MIVRCPAKVNLFLAVGPRDASGYHPLRTVFQAVGLFDELRVERTREDSFRCDDPSVPADNTVVRAWRLLREILTVPPLAVELAKSIPAQSGLGGGSSDAAGLMRAVAALTGGGPSPSEFLSVARAVGADVPFFLVGGRARGTGYGDSVEPLPDPEPEWFVIVRPNVGCSTPAMFAALDRLRYTFRDLSEGEIANDFERVAPTECLDLIKRLRECGANAAGLTGSGSAVFGLFGSEPEARTGLARLGSVEGATWIVPGLTRAQSLALD